MLLADLADILGSPVWAVLTTLLAAAAIWVSIWLYRRQRTRKSLTYEVKITELVSVHRAAKGRIKIYFGDERIERAHLVEARIENNGNVQVDDADFKEPIIFDLGPVATALTADITDTEPDDLSAQVLLRGSEVQLQPLLLNPGDRVTLKIFARDLGDVTCHYRIRGVSKMVDAAAQRQRQTTVLGRAVGSLRDGAVGATLIAGAVTVASITGISSLIEGGRGNDSYQPTHTTVVYNGDHVLCGDVLHTGEHRLILRLVSGDELRSLKLSKIDRVVEDTC